MMLLQEMAVAGPGGSCRTGEKMRLGTYFEGLFVGLLLRVGATLGTLSYSLSSFVLTGTQLAFPESVFPGSVEVL